MGTKSNWAILCIVFLFVLILFPPRVHAYIDPGTGSYIIQMVIAGIAAAAFALKMLWGRIKARFSGNQSHDNSDQDLNE